MTAAAARIAVAPRPDAVAVFTLRAWARATLWQAGEIDLHDAVDVLQQAAIENGLVDAIGQDAVQSLIGLAFQEVRG